MAQIENPGALAGASGAGLPSFAIAAGTEKLAPDDLCGKFAWPEAQTSWGLPMAVRHVRRLTGAPPSTARLYAELAGLSIAGEEGNV